MTHSNGNRELKRLTGTIIGGAISVHRALGPGLLESTYEHCLAIEFESLGLELERQVLLPISYRGKIIKDAYRIDMLVKDRVILELKAIEKVQGVHKAQLLSYLKLSGKPIGLLLNFNVTSMRQGIFRLFNEAILGNGYNTR